MSRIKNALLASAMAILASAALAQTIPANSVGGQTLATAVVNLGNYALTGSQTGGSVVRPWTSYFLGQSITIPNTFSIRTSSNVRCDYYTCTTLYDSYFQDTIVKIDNNGVVSVGDGPRRTVDVTYLYYGGTPGPVTYSGSTNSWLNVGQPVGNETLTYKGCSVFPSWSSNTNKLAGLPPDGFYASGQFNGDMLGCGWWAAMANPANQTSGGGG